MRILLLIAIGLMVYMIINRLLNAKSDRHSTDNIAGDLVACAHCGTHVLQQDAIPSENDNDRYYCCVEHQRLKTKD